MPHATSTSSTCHVLVLGAGPAGVFAAHALARAGVNVRIIDQKPRHLATGQADGIQPRTLEVFNSYGLVEKLFESGTQVHMAAFYNPSPDGKGITRTGRAPDVNAPSARWPFKILLNQGKIERILIDAMKPLGVTVERPYAPSSMEWSADPAQISVQNEESYPIKVTIQKVIPPSDKNSTGRREGSVDTHHIRSKFVIGADGAHSWVRKTLGFAMEGEQTDFVWGVVDTIPSTDFPDIRNRCAIHSPKGSIMVIPREGEMVRFYIQLTGALVEGEGRVDRSKWSVERLCKVAQEIMQPYTLTFPNPIDWWTLYQIGQRVASSFSMKERIFIVGDACHTHSPKAGQGMNASMNDSHNLCWKIAHVLKGWANPDILKTYEYERRKYAQDLIAFDKRFSAVFSAKPWSEEHPEGVTHQEFLEVHQTFGGFSSGISVHYGPSLLVSSESSSQALAKNLPIGTRLLPSMILRVADYRPFEIQDLHPSDLKWKLVIFAGDAGKEDVQMRLEGIGKRLVGVEGRGGLLRGFAGDVDELFSWIVVSSTKKFEANYTDIPLSLRPHWSRAYIDDTPLSEKGDGGKTYATYGISTDEGAIVVVRPDGYVGAVVKCDENGVDELGGYLHGVLIGF